MSHTPRSTTRTGAKSKPSPIERIVVAAGSPASGARLYSLAVRLAHLCEVDVDAVFVEDATLVHLAGLPFARVVNVHSALIEPLDFETLASQIRSDADKLRALFFGAAGAKADNSSFSVLQGKVCQELVAQTRPGDLLVCAANESHLESLFQLGRTTSELLSVAHCSIWIDRGGRSDGGAVVGILDAEHPPWHVLRQAAYWAERRGARLVYAISERCPDPQQVSRQIRDFMYEAEIYHGQVVEGVSLEKLLEAEAALVLLDSARFRSTPDSLRNWLRRTSLPLLLVAET